DEEFAQPIGAQPISGAGEARTTFRHERQGFRGVTRGAAEFGKQELTAEARLDRSVTGKSLESGDKRCFGTLAMRRCFDKSNDEEQNSLNHFRSSHYILREVGGIGERGAGANLANMIV